MVSYVRSRSNPADIASRGLDISVPETKKLWLEGSSWLKSSARVPTEVEPLDSATPTSQLFEVERKPTVSACMTSCVDPTSEIFFENRCHSWIQAIRFWAFVRRLKSKRSKDQIQDQTSKTSPTSRSFHQPILGKFLPKRWLRPDST